MDDLYIAFGLLLGNGCPIRQGVALVDHHGVLIVDQDLHGKSQSRGFFPEIVLILPPEPDDGNFRLAFGEIIQRPLHMALPDHAVKGRIRCQGADIVGHYPEGRLGMGNAHPQQIAHGVVRAQHGHGVHFPQNIMGVLQKNGPTGGGMHALAGPLENGKAHAFLHVPQDSAQVRLAQIEIFRRLGDGVDPLDLHQVLNVFDVHFILLIQKGRSKLPRPEFLRLPCPLQRPVPVVEQDVQRHHGDVGKVEVESQIVGTGHDLGDHTTNIPQKYKIVK